MTDRIDSMGAAELRVKLADVLDQIRFDSKPVAITRFDKIVAWIVPADFRIAEDMAGLLQLSVDVQNIRNERRYEGK